MLIEFTLLHGGKRTVSLHEIRDIRPGIPVGAAVVLKEGMVEVQEGYEDIVAALRRTNLMVTV